jgi:hypothetical protein
MDTETLLSNEITLQDPLKEVCTICRSAHRGVSRRLWNEPIFYSSFILNNSQTRKTNAKLSSAFTADRQLLSHSAPLWRPQERPS